MDNTINQNESIRIAHLAMAQGIITRMGTNSFTLKALSVTICSATIVISATAENLSPVYVLVTVVPIFLFWCLDSQYLRYERAYIELYNCVRKGDSIDEYSLEVKPFLNKVDSILRTALSWSLRRFYLTLLGLIGFTALLNLGGFDVFLKCSFWK